MDKNRLPILAFAAIVFLFGLNFIAVKFSNMELAPFWGASLRFFIATAILMLINRIKGISLPKGKNLFAAIMYGLLLFFATYGLLYWALLSAGAGMASVMFAAIPLITMIIASFLGLEKFSARGLAGSGVVIAGIAIIYSEQIGVDVPVISLIAVFMAAVSAAISGIIVKLTPQNSPLAMNAVGMATGAVLLLILSSIIGEPVSLPSLAETWLALAWLVFSTIVAFILFVWIVGKWSASRASYTGVLPPLITLPAAALLLGETIGLTFLGGTLLVLLGVYIGVLS
jgi:drug/metabolite transporter (DMT)-like permease